MDVPRPARSGEDVIRSPDNRTVKLIRSLRQRKSREAERAFVVEGFRAIADGLAAGARPTVVAIREGEEAASRRWFGDGFAKRIIDAGLFEKLSDTVTPQGALAVFPLPDREIVWSTPPLVLILDRVRDPGNVGTLIRSAAGAGADAVLLTQGSVDPFNPKSVRSAVGAHFRVPIGWLTDHARGEIVARCPTRVVADAGGSLGYDEIDLTSGVALIVGSEAAGVGPGMSEFATLTARSPLAGELESLNAAAAGAIMLFEAVRQRRRGEFAGSESRSPKPGVDTDVCGKVLDSSP
jgi:RNA methyltransferase, TrmH family